MDSFKITPMDLLLLKSELENKMQMLDEYIQTWNEEIDRLHDRVHQLEVLPNILYLIQQKENEPHDLNEK